MKKIIILLTLFLCSSCSYHEVNDLAIVDAFAIDYKNNNYILTYEIIDNNESYTIYSSSNTLEDAFNKIDKITPNKIDLSHLNILVTSSEIINNHMNVLKDYILNNKYITPNFYTVIAKNYSPLEILSFKDNKYFINGSTIKKLLVNENIKITDQFDYLCFNNNLLLYYVTIDDHLLLSGKFGDDFE